MSFEMGKPTDEHRRLHAMAGSWRSEETLHPSPWDPKAGSATGRSESRVVLDGLVVVTDYEQTKDGRVGYRGHGVYGYDVRQGRPFMQWCDNMMPAAPATVWGTWKGNVLTFEMAGPQGHNRYVYDFDGDRAYTFGIRWSRDGKDWKSFMDGLFTRA
jgi:uncharacterized protein DUF1579